MSNSPSFAGKVVLVTGANSGIGRATAIAFGRSGAKVVIGDLNEGAAETASLITGAGGEALFVKADVSQAESFGALVEAAVKAHDRLGLRPCRWRATLAHRSFGAFRHVA